MAGTGGREAPGRAPRRWGPARLLLAVLVAAVAAGGVAAPQPLHARELVLVAEAYTAAWNAHDLPAVLARFAPDAVVRRRRGDVPAVVWDTRDPQVALAYLDGADAGANYDADGFAWAIGRPQIAAWAAAHFKEHHRFEVAPPRAAGDTVGWRYREFVDPFQLVRGVSPAEGAAEAVVRGGTIARLTLVESPASVQRRRREAGAALDRVVAIRRASPLAAGPSLPLRGPPRAADPTPGGWPLALGGLALLAAATAARRRRRLP